MAGVKNSKLKLLVLKDILSKKTDEEHPVSAKNLCAMLNAQGLPAERKSIYKDIDILREYGIDIILSNDKDGGYFCGSREFELAELRLLSDAVQAANFISVKKTKQLVEKIEGFASDSQAKRLHEQVYVDNRPKCNNEELYYTISSLDEAINSNKKVSFSYQRRHITETFHTVLEEKDFTVSPYAMIWSDDHYYLICNNEKYDNLMHLRIDRMKKLSVTDFKSRHFSEVSSYRNRFDSADYASKLYQMFGGEQKPVELICDNSILEPMLDRFGDNVRMTKYDDTHFLVRTDAVISEGLVAWVMQYGGRISINSPNELKRMVCERARDILNQNSQE